jgi:hypothetical protein
MRNFLPAHEQSKNGKVGRSGHGARGCLRWT